MNYPLKPTNNIYPDPLGFGDVPPIRPLETLHNALSLRKLDSFLQDMILAQIFKTPTGSPPRCFEPPCDMPAVSSMTLGTHRPPTLDNVTPSSTPAATPTEVPRGGSESSSARQCSLISQSRLDPLSTSQEPGKKRKCYRKTDIDWS